MNSLRSTFRKNIFAGLETQEDISKWVSLSNLFTFMPRAIFPLIASLLIVSISADIILSVTGIIVFLMISILTYILRQKQRKNTLLNNIKVGKNTHVCNHS
ncbi:hypothetical protein JCM31447_28160 [Fluviispira sanaruensis]|uniref:Uncharacterized protein n=1 Tax=Fluviispira sanaruensis TaxID=2493639 RepID=A0A4P2VZP0_FLUSA|nr:hypothetical protein JCM31447_28160 [Fluviispira sanaruensis]